MYVAPSPSRSTTNGVGAAALARRGAAPARRALVTMMREYSSLQAYEQDARRLCKSGWSIVSALDRPSSPDWLERVTRGISCLAFPPGREYLVTYEWQGSGRLPLPDVRNGAEQPALARAWRAMNRRYWWWTLAIVVLFAILLYGVLDFLAT